MRTASASAAAAPASSDAEAALLPTPLYNQMVLEDTALRSHLEELYRYTTDCPEFATALQLFKVWLRQRSLRSDTEKLQNAGASFAFGALHFLSLFIAQL